MFKLKKLNGNCFLFPYTFYILPMYMLFPVLNFFFSTFSFLNYKLHHSAYIFSPLIKVAEKNNTKPGKSIFFHWDMFVFHVHRKLKL